MGVGWVKHLYLSLKQKVFQMSDKVIADLKQKVIGILGKEFINVDPSNDGGPGDTFEKLLGVKLNNLRLPDFGGVVELKTGKLSSGMTKQSYLTLFHRNPLPTKGYTKATNSLILEAVGWNHSGLCNPRKKGEKCKSRKINGHLQETDQLYTTGTDGFKRSTGRCYPMGEKSFRSTTYFTKTGYKNGAKASSRGLYLDIEGDFLIMDFDPLLVDTKKKTQDDVGKFFQHTYQDWLNDISTRNNPHYSNVFPVRYKIADLYNDYVNKLSNALFCTYKQSGGSMKKIIFQEAYLLGNPVGIDKFKTLLKTGALVVDFDQRTNHDHAARRSQQNTCCDGIP